ncbi:hypothetical protein DFH09DRAFT_1457668 [Mycena vulgaris]|nr:hypothetical protein DFH09DRAFT_1457668 [Mycena vulgaris]
MGEVRTRLAVDGPLLLSSSAFRVRLVARRSAPSQSTRGHSTLSLVVIGIQHCPGLRLSHFLSSRGSRTSAVRLPVVYSPLISLIVAVAISFTLSFTVGSPCPCIAPLFANIRYSASVSPRMFGARRFSPWPRSRSARRPPLAAPRTLGPRPTLGRALPVGSTLPSPSVTPSTWRRLNPNLSASARAYGSPNAGRQDVTVTPVAVPPRTARHVRSATLHHPFNTKTRPQKV